MKVAVDHMITWAGRLVLASASVVLAACGSGTGSSPITDAGYPVDAITGTDSGIATLDSGPSDASDAATTISITVDTTSILRSDITAATFGSGIEHQNYVFPSVMNIGGSATATRTAMAAMDLGTMRFPNGTKGLFYCWDDPSASYISAPSVQPSMIITPSQMYSYTDGSSPNSFNMGRLFEVNTWFGLQQGSNSYYLINQNDCNTSIAPVIDATNLTIAANYAAGWVTNNATGPESDLVNDWEVGNEDWSWWSPEQYAQIFNAFATSMKAAQPGIRLLAQTLTSRTPRRAMS